MTRIDQFESVFRAAARPLYDHASVRPQKVLAITDLDADRAAAYVARAQPFFANLHGDVTIEAITGEACRSIDQLLTLVTDHAPDLIVTYRCLHSQAWQWPYTIGDHIEVLTQVSDKPVLLLPRIDEGHGKPTSATPTTVVALTDHLSGDSRLVNWAAAFASNHKLVLAHVEDDAVFERYMGLIGKTPNIDTEVARRDLGLLVLQEPRTWAEACQKAFEGVADAPSIEVIIRLGHRLAAYADVVNERDADLLVLNTKDDDQLAIHGLAYPLMIELRHIPMLLL